jgi:hypothetical protein
VPASHIIVHKIGLKRWGKWGMCGAMTEKNDVMCGGVAKKSVSSQS